MGAADVKVEYHLLTRKEAMHKGHDVVEQVGSVKCSPINAPSHQIQFSVLLGKLLVQNTSTFI